VKDSGTWEDPGAIVIGLVRNGDNSAPVRNVLAELVVMFYDNEDGVSQETQTFIQPIDSIAPACAYEHTWTVEGVAKSAALTVYDTDATKLAGTLVFHP
jgi:hypothetical protein